MSKIRLVQPDNKLVGSYLGFMSQMRDLGEKVWEGMIPKQEESLEDFVSRLLREETSPEAGLVAQTTSWAICNHEVVGRIALRHTLNKNLEEFGGLCLGRSRSW
jgi:predicted acetyltransferase